MARIKQFGRHSWKTVAALVLVAGWGNPLVSAQSTPPAEVPGRIDFESANLPAATVEIELSQAMIGDLMGIGDAAIAGVAESLLQTANTNDQAQGTRMAAEKLTAIRQILQLSIELVHEVRVRIYEGSADESKLPQHIGTQFDSQLREGHWENVVRVRDGNEAVQVSLVRSEGAVRGAFVVVNSGNDVVIANVVCEVSPENIKKLTTAATKIGLENGLQQLIEAKMQHMR